MRRNLWSVWATLVALGAIIPGPSHAATSGPQTAPGSGPASEPASMPASGAGPTSLPASLPASLPTSGVLEFPNTGIALTIPGTFQMQNGTEPMYVMSAVQEGPQGRCGITLMAMTVLGQSTAESCADQMAANLRKNLSIRRLEAGKKINMPVGDLTGSAQPMSYSFRGVESKAVSLCFIRELTNPRSRICYVLNVEMPASQQAQLVPFFEELRRGIKLIDLQHPGMIEIKALGPPFADPRRGYEIRPPMGWITIVTAQGIHLAQLDYIYGGIPGAYVQAVTKDTVPGKTLEDVAKDYLFQVTRVVDAKRATVVSEVLAKPSPAKLAGMDGLQFMFKQVDKEKPADVMPDILVHRTILLPGPEDAPRKSYSLVLACKTADPNTAVAAMDVIASGFNLIKIETPATGPTTAPGPESQPSIIAPPSVTTLPAPMPIPDRPLIRPPEHQPK